MGQRLSMVVEALRRWYLWAAVIPFGGAKNSQAGDPVGAIATRVLLVEDNAMVRRSIEHTLRSMGYQVLAFESGEHCIEVMRDPGVQVDLLITDVVMPKMSGKELILRVHDLRPGLPVLLMSGYDRSILASRKQVMATEHFLQKPFDSGDFLQAVRIALGAGPATIDPGKKG